MTQLALFDQSNQVISDDLPIARLNPTNPRALHTQDCYFETITDKGWRMEIAIGRSAAGYHSTPSHYTGWSGELSPVFVRAVAHDNFASAHYAAWQALIDKIGRELTGQNHSHLSDGQKQVMRNMIERAIEAQAGIKPGKQEWPQHQAA